MAKNWMSRIDDALLDRVGARPSALPVGPNHVRCPASASDFAESGPLPAARRAEPMFVPVAQYRREDFKP